MKKACCDLAWLLVTWTILFVTRMWYLSLGWIFCHSNQVQAESFKQLQGITWTGNIQQKSLHTKKLQRKRNHSLPRKLEWISCKQLGQQKCLYTKQDLELLLTTELKLNEKFSSNYEKDEPTFQCFTNTKSRWRQDLASLLKILTFLSFQRVQMVVWTITKQIINHFLLIPMEWTDSDDIRQKLVQTKQSKAESSPWMVICASTHRTWMGSRGCHRGWNNMLFWPWRFHLNSITNSACPVGLIKCLEWRIISFYILSEE